MLRIDFTRAENGKLALATCATPKGELRIDGGYVVSMPHSTGRRPARVEGTDGLIYRMLVDLADSGFAGERFEAHDGRKVCLHGVIDKKAVPVRYGGTGKNENS